MELQQEYMKAGRHAARTDLIWLCHNILGMKRVRESVHGPIVRTLQGFQDYQGEDVWNAKTGQFVYTPKHHDPAMAIPYTRPTDRRRLILAPRGWYKTSLNVIAHTIQILLNFPDATILITHASQETAEEMLGEIKRHFQSNKVMRYFFPEFCPPENKKEFGTQGKFQLPNRKHFSTAPSCSVAGVESIRTGMHYSWMKFTDIVDEKNTATAQQCQKIIHSYGMALNLLVSPEYWVDVEGTRYNYSDLYGKIIDDWHAVEKEKKIAVQENREPTLEHEVRCFVMGCYKKDLKGHKDVEEFAPDELDLPYLLDEAGHEISRFPEFFPWEFLNRQRRNRVTGEQLFASQQLNNPVETDNVAFSITDLQWKSAQDCSRIPMAYYKVTVDLAETTGRQSDFTCITVCGVDRMNRRYIVDIRHGKFLPADIIDHIFGVQLKWRPLEIKVEETGFARGLKPMIDRRCQETGIYPNFKWIQRDTQQAKVQRIMSLQPFFKNRLIWFSDGLPEHVKEQLKHELTRFPKYQHDDLLDTLADQFQGEDVLGPLKPSKTEQNVLMDARRFMLERTAEYQRVYHPGETYTSWTGTGM